MPGFELIGEEERKAINELFDDGGTLFRHGFDSQRNGRYRVQEFEHAFAEYLGVDHALAVTSGTSAIQVALVGMGIKPGDEIITQAFTFVATVEAIRAVGAKPIIVNVDDTLNMDPVELENAITSKTRAVLPVHMLGVAAEINIIRDIADRHHLPILEDNCESLGALWDGKKLGTQGAAAAFSFDFGKVMTTGEGGMVTTNDPEIYKLAHEFHDHGHENNPDFPRGRDTHRISGFNYRMTELQGAVGLVQLGKMDAMVDINFQHFSVIEQALQGLESEGVSLRRVPAKCTPLGDAVVFELPSQELALTFSARMSERGLDTKNLPGALDWHFAGKWDHIFTHYGMTKSQLWRHCLPSYKRLSRCVAVPVMVKDSAERVQRIAGILREIAEEVL